MAGGTRIIAFGSGGNAAGDEASQADDGWDPNFRPMRWPPDDRDEYVEIAPEDPDVAILQHLDDEIDDERVASGAAWLWPAIGAVAIAGWTGFFGWAMRDQLAAAMARPDAFIGLIGNWATPLVLLGVVALVTLRNSRREASRFGMTARMLSDESIRLETRLTTVNHELSLAREFIAAQARDLEALGRVAADRLSQEADRLQTLIRDNHARVETIGTVSAAALDNMEKLRGQLPVIASSAKDVTNNIGNAGRTAHAQLQAMIDGFKRLNEFGQASERQVQTLRSLVDETIGEFTRQASQLDEIASQRFSALIDRGAEFRAQLDHHEVEALAAMRGRAATMVEELEQTRQLLDAHEAESLTSMRARISALRDEGAAISRALRDGEARALQSWQEDAARIDREITETLATLETAETQALQSVQGRLTAIGEEIAGFEAALADRGRVFADDLANRRAALDDLEENAIAQFRERLASLDSEIADRRLQHERQGEAISVLAQDLTGQLDRFGQRLAEIASHGGEAEASISAGLSALTDRMAASQTALAGTDAEIAALTEASVRLLELLQASARHSGEELPQALASSETQLAGLEGRMVALRDMTRDADLQGAQFAGRIDAASSTLRLSLTELDALQVQLGSHVGSHGETLSALRQDLEHITAQSARLSEDVQRDLAIAIDRLSQSAQSAVAEIRQAGASAVTALADQLGDESAAAIERAMRQSTAETAGQLEQAIAHATGAGREAAMQMRDQLAKVNELAGNLERRVAQARERAEEQVDNDFTRRVALITESLNSNAIDIAKALSTDVADTAWAAYLRGDRGIFTRRAVNLLEGGEAKAIVQIYERDREFHDHVSRYIHDFEAMLRQVLSARDGQALGVTLLSSDMGKLYVTLAQAIERLRN